MPLYAIGNEKVTKVIAYHMRDKIRRGCPVRNNYYDSQQFGNDLNIIFCYNENDWEVAE